VLVVVVDELLVVDDPPRPPPWWLGCGGTVVNGVVLVVVVVNVVLVVVNNVGRVKALSADIDMFVRMVPSWGMTVASKVLPPGPMPAAIGKTITSTSAPANRQKR
jgi:hypothetical protein